MGMPTDMVLLYCFLIGCVCGLRSMTGPALVCWGIFLGWLTVAHSPLAFLANPISLAVFSILAVGELVADKLPKIPSRTEPGPVIVRMCAGALCGWVLAMSEHAGVVPGAISGVVGAVTGAFAGYRVRRAVTRRVKDWPVAVIEDLIAVGGGLLLVSRF